MDLTRFAPGFLGANGLYATLGLGVLQIDAAVRAFALRQWVVLALGVIVLELVTLAVLWWLDRHKVRAGRAKDPFQATPEAILIRNSRREDVELTGEVYREWFPSSQLIDPADFARLTSRAVHVRVAEEIYADGVRRVVGYYTIWPMTQANYDSLVEGRLKECEFTSDMILPPDSPEAEVLYIGEICVRKASNAGGFLLRDAMSYVRCLVDQNAAISVVAAWASTSDGRSIAGRVGMTRARRSSGKLTDFYGIGRRDALQMLTQAASFTAERRSATIAAPAVA